MCTGDLVNLALEPEFRRVGQLLGDRFQPDELTLVPGNHDYYVKEAVDDRLFESSFGHWQPRDVAAQQDEPYPVSRLKPGLAVFGLNSAIPTPVFMANGEASCSACAIEVDLEEPAIDGCFKMLLIPSCQSRSDVLTSQGD